MCVSCVYKYVLADVMGSTLLPGLEKTFDKTFKDVPSHLCLDTKQMKPFVKKYKDKLLSERRYENDMFTRDVRSKNLLSFLYLFDGDGKSAKEESETPHAGDPSSVVGLVTKILIAYKNNDICCAKEMVTTLNEMIKSPDWEVIKLKGKAEIGFCNAYFCPFLIPSAVDILTFVLKDGVNNAPDSPLSKIPMDLKVLWNYELAHAYKIQLANSDARSQSMSFDLNAVFGEFMRLSLAVIKSGDTWLTARALVDLADGFVRSETQEGWIKGTKLPDNMTTESCMRQAATTNPRDPHVMEKCGIFLKQKANSVDQFEEAIQNLNKAVALNESRHVALHHLALAFIAIWHINSDHKEKWLYVNQVRKKKQKPRSSSNRNQVKTVTAKLSNEAKMEHRGPFRFGKLKSNITRDKDKKSPSHELLKAKEYMEKACEINSTSALYRIDLARICFSLYQDDQAFLNLDKAAGVENMSEYDKSYLYEQYGLILHHRRKHYAAKGYYQLSVRASIQMKKHSRIAFYELEQLLKNLCETAESQEEEKECTEELYHIYKLIERFEEAEMYIHVDDPERLWKFIDMKHRRNKNSDAYTLLLPQLDVESSNTERRGLIFQVAIGATREQSFENSAAPHVSQDIFRRLFAWHFNATDQNEVEYDVALITDPDGDDYSQHTEDIMETIHAIGLKVSHDVEPNESVFSLIGKSRKAHCVSILIESEQISTSFMAVIEELRSIRKEDRLRVITAGGLEERHIPSPLKSVSTLGMEEFSKESLFCLLCKCNIPKQ